MRVTLLECEIARGGSIESMAFVILVPGVSTYNMEELIISPLRTNGLYVCSLGKSIRSALRVSVAP